MPVAADIISAIEFDGVGQHLATGDRGGRVVLFERVATQQVWSQLWHAMEGARGSCQDAERHRLPWRSAHQAWITGQEGHPGLAALSSGT